MSGSEPWPPLLPTDHAIVESIRRGAPDAEIAARVGLSIRDVKERIERLQRRFDSPDRASLGDVDLSKAEASALTSQVPANSRPTGPDLFAPAPGEPTASEPAASEPGPPPTEDPDRPVHSRRAVLGALFAGGATLAGVGAYFLVRESGSTPLPARADPFATSTPPPTATPTPPPTPHPGASAIHPASGAWTSTAYSNGSEIDLEHGVCFVDSSTGDFEVCQLAGAIPAEVVAHGYRISPGNDLIAAESYPGGTQESTIFRRSTGESFAWDAGTLRLRILTDDLIVFEETDTNTEFGSENPQPTGRYSVVDGDFMPLSRPDIAQSGHDWPQVVESVAGEQLLIVAGQLVHLADARTGEVRGMLLPQVEGRSLTSTFAEAVKIGPREIFRVVAFAAGPGEDAHLDAYEVTIDPTGVMSQPRAVPMTPHGWGMQLPSPDGRYLLRSGSLRDNYAGHGDNEDWTYAELLDAETNEPRFRVLSGNLQYSFGWNRRWLADSSAFVIESQPPDSPLEAYGEWRQSRQLSLVSPAGELEHLDVPDQSSSFGWNHVEPAPTNPDLFSLGRLRVWNRATGQVLGPTGDLAPQYHDPWGNDSDEMRFAFPMGGHGATGIGTILPPMVERPPYREEIDLVIARAGTCVNLRELPTLDADILECLPDDTPLQVVDPDVSPDEGTNGASTITPAFAGVAEEGGAHQAFVHVQTESGREGWVAIQYLNWA